MRLRSDPSTVLATILGKASILVLYRY